ncbi:sodium:proton antiporter [Thiohalorhabdus denitrificans]|uniref:Na(+)/H(+) antiporter NhaA n=1 Tax=Thiohalorhabdus denitrificans TaxID=381306 RepID=A0A0P9ESC4_9GAMM|nr:Na+/H+ antiporter NhaA [Thiohalorhabdus denitrificans]KPV41507.1 sodium:proton antiporter [Thiohalorhabdus denitrificans]SCY29840.1 sodium/proton antiporter, NhaA family [Thiohalorhabdus denitrificans]
MKKEGDYQAPLEPTFERIATPFEEFIHQESASGLLLIATTLLALVAANSVLGHFYHDLLHIPIAFSIGPWTLEHSLHHWINDGLMGLFFFVVGLEIKREVLVGELASVRQAAVPIVAAIGGMLVPAGIYFLINPEGPMAAGWAIPMATDIAFAVGIMVLLGSRVPKTLLTFLVALAIVDDLGAVAVIALFYTEDIALGALGLGGLFLGTLVAFNLLGIRKPWPYFLVGIFLWLAMLQSGIHATLAGILTAWTIPARPKFDPRTFSRLVRQLMDRFDQKVSPGRSLIHNPDQHALVQTLENGVHQVETPLQRLEHLFHLPVALLVIPIFAFANAGIPLHLEELGNVVSEPVTLGIILGLVVGKPLGVAGGALLAARLGIGELPAGVRTAHVVGAGMLSGIGFTMSIFIANLGFAGMEETIVLAKTGILAASLMAGLGGTFWLVAASRRDQEALEAVPQEEGGTA